MVAWKSKKIAPADADGWAFPARPSRVAAMREPPSPCNQVCRIDPENGLCLGCKRTLEEIADWPMLSRSDKLELLAALKKR